MDFLSKDLSNLLKESFDDDFIDEAEEGELIPVNKLSSLSEGIASYKIEYQSNSDFESIAKKIGLMSDLKAGVPRGAYLGIVPFKYKGNSVYLVPARPWTGYRE